MVDIACLFRAWDKAITFSPLPRGLPLSLPRSFMPENVLSVIYTIITSVLPIIMS